MSFVITPNSAFINFNSTYCTNSQQLLSSDPFKKILDLYLKHLEKQHPTWYVDFKEFIVDTSLELRNEIIKVYKLLLVFKANEIQHPYLKKMDLLTLFSEELYNFWRRFERYAVISHKNERKGLTNVSFMDADAAFNDLIRSTYRRINETLIGSPYMVYRQLSAGTNAGIILNEQKLILNSPYESLSSIPTLSTVLIHAPFIIYPKNTKRDGVFKEVFFNPIDECEIVASQWFCFPIKVGVSLALVYFHRDYMSIGISLANLFAPASEQEYRNQKADIIYVYGGEHHLINEAVFHYDSANDIFVGFAPKGDEITYFGYMKKMLLTLHNLRTIKKGMLPIHGAMVSILFKDKKRKNVVIMGDSGAGKSETLEALRTIASEDILDMQVIFDDMGTFHLINNQLIAYGTEIGAFVRLDDLDSGYAYKEIDRAIFINPDKANARTIIPVSYYADIVKGTPVDLFLYANNFEENEQMMLFSKKEEAIAIFKEGRRKALQTTTESGVVSSYFANPFGPLQWKNKCDPLIEKYFQFIFDSHIPIGQIYTHLGIEGKAKKGPSIAAMNLLKLVKTL